MIRLALFAFSAFLALNAAAAEVSVSDAWIRVLPGGAPAGGYFVLHNDSRKPVTLVGASSPAFGHVMMHETTETGGVSRMVPVIKLELPPGGKAAFSPGGHHLMLMHAHKKIEPGTTIPITLEFSGGLTVTTAFQARGPAGR